MYVWVHVCVYENMLTLCTLLSLYKSSATPIHLTHRDIYLRIYQRYNITIIITAHIPPLIRRFGVTFGKSSYPLALTDRSKANVTIVCI